MIQSLIEGLRQICAHGAAAAEEGREQLALVQESVDWQAEALGPAPQSLPLVETWLAAATAQPSAPEARDFLRALGTGGRDLHWVVPYPTYAGEPDIDAFRSSYAFASLCDGEESRRGETAVLPGRGVFAGVTLQAPHTFYPSHVHKAVEVYYVLAGEAEWQRGGGDFVVRPPGSFILHGSGARHAMRTHDQPLLAIAFWVSDLNSEVVIVRD